MQAQVLNNATMMLLWEFFAHIGELSAVHSNSEEDVRGAIKEAWSRREDIADAMKSHFDDMDESGNREHVLSLWMEEVSCAFPKARFWQMALFRVCAYRSAQLHRKLESERMNAEMMNNPNWGVF